MSPILTQASVLNHKSDSEDFISDVYHEQCLRSTCAYKANKCTKCKKGISEWLRDTFFSFHIHTPAFLVIIFTVVVNILLPTTAADDFALLSGTLRTYQQAGCDEEMVILNCPIGTHVIIEFAQYGKADPGTLCPAEKEKTARRPGYLPATFQHTNTSCFWPTAMQYSLLQSVVDVCQNKQHCKFHPSTKTFMGDPCPGMRKYVEVAYKCRPYEYIQKVVCENDVIQLKCDPYFRIAVHSASYGRTKYESVYCPQPQGVAEETCLVSYATEAVMHVCHGKRHCTLAADAATFGNPCRPASRMYLKVVYTCIPRHILKDTFNIQLEEDEIETTATIHDMEAGIEQSTSNDNLKKLVEPPIYLHPDNSTGDAPLVTSTGTPSHRKTKNKFTPPDNSPDYLYLYIIVSVASGILICTILIVAQVLVRRHRRRKAAKEDNKYQSSSNEHSLPNGFGDDISYINDDIVLSTPLPVPVHQDNMRGVVSVVGYSDHSHCAYQMRQPPTTFHTIQRSEDAPRGLARAPDSHYYYG